MTENIMKYSQGHTLLMKPKGHHKSQSGSMDLLTRFDLRKMINNLWFQTKMKLLKRD